MTDGGQGARVDVSAVVAWDGHDVADLTAADFRAMTIESLSYLRAIVRSCPTGRQAGNGIAAAHHVLEFVRFRESLMLDREQFDFERAQRQIDPEKLLAELLGDERKLLAWMRGQLPKLEAKLGEIEDVERPAGNR